jgi:hypothetical protein
MSRKHFIPVIAAIAALAAPTTGLAQSQNRGPAYKSTLSHHTNVKRARRATVRQRFIHADPHCTTCAGPMAY